MFTVGGDDFHWCWDWIDTIGAKDGDDDDIFIVIVDVENFLKLCRGETKVLMKEKSRLI